MKYLIKAVVLATKMPYYLTLRPITDLTQILVSKPCFNRIKKIQLNQSNSVFINSLLNHNLRLSLLYYHKYLAIGAHK